MRNQTYLIRKTSRRRPFLKGLQRGAQGRAISLAFRAAIAATVCTTGVSLRDAQAEVTLPSPPQGLVETASPCPVAPCTAPIDFEANLSGAPVDSAALVFTPDAGVGFIQPICSPPDPIEGIPGCPAPPIVFERTLNIAEGDWNVVARVARGAAEETSEPVHFTVLPPNTTPVGPVGLSEVAPNLGFPGIRVLEASAANPNGIVSTPSEVEIIGQNLDNNPFLQVYLAPKPFGEPQLTAESALPVQDWCLFEATIVAREPLGGGDSKLRVRLPELPAETPSLCGISPTPEGSIFTQDWRWVIRDPWLRPERVHSSWAIPSPRNVPWQNAPAFKVVKPPYPLLEGFEFTNQATDAKYNEFLTVFGNNAYLCVDCVPLVGCACILPRIPDPLYLLWWPIYMWVIDDTGGSCNGMASTSLLMARGELPPQGFESDVLFPAGFGVAGDPATYEDTNFCTPFCSPPKAKNLWANIRMNHGVQFSREFLVELLDTLGEAIFDPNDVTSIKGVPNATLERVRDNPLGHVLCFFEPGNGHCVTPYRVDGNRIFIYDNSAPGDVQRFIEIVGGEYDYPARRNIDSKSPNKGRAIMAFPINIWKQGRHVMGLKDLVGTGGVEFLYMIAVGSGDIIVTNEQGGSWGWEDDGTFTDSLFGAVSIGPLGPQDEDARAMPLLLAMNQPAPAVQINADGGQYYFHAGEGGHLLQLEAADALAGDKDQVELGYVDGDLASFDFTPQRDANHLVPRIGLVIGEGESTVFNWLGLKVPGGKTVGFGASKEARAVSYRNDTGGPTQHILALDYGAEIYGRMIYGPFEVPDGAEQRVVLESWPDAGTVVSQLDFDRDGTPDHSETVVGRPAYPPKNIGTKADLSVEEGIAPETLYVGEVVAHSVLVANQGPDDATSVMFLGTLPSSAEVSSVQATAGQCRISDDGVTCALGDLLVGESVMITYIAKTDGPGSLANGTMVFGNEWDPDWTNNSVVTTAQVR